MRFLFSVFDPNCLKVRRQKKNDAHQEYVKTDASKVNGVGSFGYSQYLEI